MRIPCWLQGGHDWREYSVSKDHHQRRDCIRCEKHQKGYEVTEGDFGYVLWMTLDFDRGGKAAKHQQ